MEMHQVRYFLAVARTLNFTRAAEECNVTQPSLTRAVQKLEDELGGLLFRRERSLTHLTDLGRMMLPHLERTYEAAQAAKALARGLQKAQVAPLSLGIATSIDLDEVAAVLDDVARSLPGLELTLESGTSSELIDRAMRGDIDLLLVEAPLDAPDRLEAWRLFAQRHHMIARAGHPLAGRPEVSFAEVADEPWIDCGADGSLRLRHVATAAGREPVFRHKVGGPAQARQMVLAGLGSAVMPRPSCGDDRLVALAFLEEEFVAPVILAGIAGRRRSPAADALIRAARTRAWPDR